MDRGYHITLAVWRAEKQLVLQLVFVNSGHKYTGTETLSSATVASDRLGNKRAVNRSKKLNCLQRVLKANMNPERLNNVWLA